ncbi:hypothetical protein [Clostridium saccharobutylicum]|uniref:Uncharacterized protein n=1 Tax=Clostridium saccharobutylicum DSM 13864 TaxID=1345695 RepID=U5MP50_CLOSA|nr:hypothetical protein [Clostridium saccharobutylicum]AGX42564.1 hypothetical protein CLSA_c15650 [Clostridium saccharobutylicum DSM 13864]AQR89850.1 hypothetical protein CLOSC_15550 [Clostridium saccharobutylicum]AQR99754.1 hypothetical protein CSACC_15630 [Clostridium saccharobutylicum]AQS09482.1 hypothetical protein CLOBY_16110 [Clostridium saccharobutylicum]AQS13738.1 hypothetical protein CLOSACC_15630 [Clostridium saccharobutylicum]
MIKNYLIKAISLTTLVISSTAANPICVKAEDNVNIQQIKSEILKQVNPNQVFGINVSKDELEFQGETTVKKEFYYEDTNYTNVNLADEKLYHFSYNKYATISFYYGLTSKCIYMQIVGHDMQDVTIFKDENIYAYFFKNTNKYTTTHGWIGNNGWDKEVANAWRYFKDGIVQTGLIRNGGNWYYCYSNGDMAHDTIIDGYHLNSSGAWDY